MRKLAALLTATAALAVPLAAQQMQMPGAKDRAAITGGSYTADRNHTLVVWEVNHFGFSPLSGIFGEITGTLDLDPANPAAARVDVTIPVSKVVTGVPGFTAHLLRPAGESGKPDFFGAAPADARFVSTRVVPIDEDEARVEGTLTLNGVTRPVTLDVDFYGAGTAPARMGGQENVGFEATATIRRSEFGLGMAVPIVSDEVELEIAAAFQKAPATAAAPADACGAAKVRGHVGHPANPAMRAAVARDTGAKAIRWLTPGTAVTMDYRPDRLNVELDKAGVVRSARCG